ncbi:MAG: hypothetical protein HY764_02020 [Candidatus Portnoybacteria bacterium]|nr:hypothetical protein [Candidatus Portnoybacteria bacterium]
MYGVYRRLGDGFKRSSRSYYPGHLGQVDELSTVFQGGVEQLNDFIWADSVHGLKVAKKEGEPWIRNSDCLAASH